MAAPSYVFTVHRIAKLLGENEELLEEIGMTMDPEEGRLWVYDADDMSTMHSPTAVSRTSKSSWQT